MRTSDYTCPDCGRHAAVCVKSSGHLFGHNAVRDTLLQIADAAGFTVERERSLPSNPSLRPADILIHGWANGQPAAIDVSIVAPNSTLSHPSSEASMRGEVSFLDLVSNAKVGKYHIKQLVAWITGTSSLS